MKTFNYGEDELQALDLYQPKEWNGKTLVLIHGGGWWQGDKGKEKEVATGLATEGYQVAALNYRLATQAKNLFPTQDEDVEAAYKMSQISRLIISPLLVAQQVDI